MEINKLKHYLTQFNKINRFKILILVKIELIKKAL